MKTKGGAKVAGCQPGSVTDIDRARGVVQVLAAKGVKDRYVSLPAAIQPGLADCGRTRRNPIWLFPSVGRGGTRGATATSPVPPAPVRRSARATAPATAALPLLRAYAQGTQTSSHAPRRRSRTPRDRATTLRARPAVTCGPYPGPWLRRPRPALAQPPLCAAARKCAPHLVRSPVPPTSARLTPLPAVLARSSPREASAPHVPATC